MPARRAENIGHCVITALALVHATTAADVSKQTALNAVLVASAVHFAAIPARGALSDRIGRRPAYLIGAAGVGLWVCPFFSPIGTGSFGNLLLAVTVGLVLHGAVYAPQDPHTV